MSRKLLLYLPFTIILTLTYFKNYAQPSGFIDEAIANDWKVPVGLTFDANGRMYVWEKSGKVFIVENGIKQANPVIDITEEVLDYGDHGLNGFALDPDFLKNGYVYLMFVAKRHHVLNFGKSTYNPNDESPFQNTIGKIARYTLTASNDFRAVDYDSRKILIGESATTGIPILADNHGVGTLVFSPDGTLLASVGDGALATDGVVDDSQNPFFQEAIDLGFIGIDQNINAFRSQYLNSLDGKILRLDPNTGNGIPSNPFYESTNPRSAKSRTWAYGLRNPFRIAIKPNTGSSKASDGNPGTIFLGDVGWFHREELNIVTKGGQNFGWPTYEGIDFVNKSYQNSPFSPKVFQKPAIDWRGTVAQAVFNDEYFAVGSPQFKGNPFAGIASIGGLWYNYSQFPREYQNLYYHADYEGWIKAFKFDDKNNATEVIDFVSDVHPTCLAINPKDGAIYYTNYFYPNIQEIRRLSYNPNANRKPVVVQTATPIYGKSPLSVTFKAGESKDPEGTNLKFEWDFGDGKTSNEANPVYSYGTNEGKSATYFATVKVTDGAGLTATKAVKIFVDNTPPTIINSSLDKIDVFDNLKDFSIMLNAQVSDAEQNDIKYVWSVLLYHDDHIHFITSLYKLTGETTLGVVPCDAQKYYYKVTLTATDSDGLSSTYEKIITPKCPEPLSISNEKSALTLAPNPTESSIDIFPMNGIANRVIKMTFFQTNGTILLEKEGYWQEIKPLLDAVLAKIEEGNFLLKISYDNFSKTFKIIKNH